MATNFNLFYISFKRSNSSVKMVKTILSPPFLLEKVSMQNFFSLKVSVLETSAILSDKIRDAAMLCFFINSYVAQNYWCFGH